MQTPQDILNTVSMEIRDKISVFIEEVTAITDSTKKRLQDSQNREKNLERQFKQLEQKNLQLNQEWQTVLTFREQSTKKISESFFAQNKICSKLQSSHINPPAEIQKVHQQSNENQALYQSIIEQKSLLSVGERK